jgi:integrase
VIPLSRRVCASLSLWFEQFPGAGLDSFLFLYHKVGTPVPPHAFASNSRVPLLYDLDLQRPMGSWRKAWRLACKAACVRHRPHDMRHTFISRLAEDPTVSEQTIKALAGHVSRQMLERYSHIRSQAKQAAIQALDGQAIAPMLKEGRYSFRYTFEKADNSSEANSLKTNGGPARIRTLDQRIMSPLL